MAQNPIISGKEIKRNDLGPNSSVSACQTSIPTCSCSASGSCLLRSGSYGPRAKPLKRGGGWPDRTIMVGIRNERRRVDDGGRSRRDVEAESVLVRDHTTRAEPILPHVPIGSTGRRRPVRYRRSEIERFLSERQEERPMWDRPKPQTPVKKEIREARSEAAPPAAPAAKPAKPRRLYWGLH